MQTPTDTDRTLTVLVRDVLSSHIQPCREGTVHGSFVLFERADSPPSALLPLLFVLPSIFDIFAFLACLPALLFFSRALSLPLLPHAHAA
jgi:hypothetical protein